MEDDHREKNLATATVAVANPNHNIDRRLKINCNVDSISSLPEEILHKILSSTPIKLAITTSVLSKRWRHLWRETPCIDIDSLVSSGESINKTLASYSASKITSFRLCTVVGSEKKVKLVNSLIEFAISRNVDKLSLEVGGNRFMIKDYSFPDFVFTDSSLKQLIVDTGYDRLMPRCNVSWTSLRSLSLNCVHLSAESFCRMLFGCPMLESLTLKYIGSIEYLDLSKSLRLKRLDFDLSPCGLEPVKIVAPHIRSLRLRNLRVRDDKSQRVRNNKSPNYVLQLCYANDPLKTVIHAMLQTVLEKLQNVKNLTLGVRFLQMLSIAEFRGVLFPTIYVKTLTLETRIFRSIVPGIAMLLQNSLGLQKIKIYAVKCSTEVDDNVNSYLEKRNLNSDQCWRLKEVVSTASWECEVAEPKLVGWFVEFLLANAKTLETLVLRLGNYFDISRFRELSQITNTLSHNKKVSIVIK